MSLRIRLLTLGSPNQQKTGFQRRYLLRVHTGFLPSVFFRLIASLGFVADHV